MNATDELILKDLKEYVSGFEVRGDYSNIGKIMSLGDGIANISGLSEASMGEVVTFGSGVSGVVINLKKDYVSCVVLGDFLSLNEGDEARSTGELLKVSVSKSLLGRIIDPILTPLDGKGHIKSGKDSRLKPVEKVAPGIIFRGSVNTPLETGIIAIDSMIPVGRGQRELIIGDRNTGKTAIAIDTIINLSRLNKAKKGKKVISIYVAIGQKQSKVVQIAAKLESYGALDETIIIAANSSDPVSLQYIAPYVGCAIGEYFMENGEDVLIVYDDLTKHAWSYRQISLSLRRPSGREAYPGDIFYLHSRLLERACKLSKKEGGGSLTAFPVIETQAQDISSYIPTNVISITDGQIYLEPDLFYQGVRPAINVGLSVSRVGSAAQLPIMKKVAGRLRLELAQFNELSSFSQFGSDLDEATKAKLERGKRLMEILKQPQYSPVDITDQILAVWFVTNGFLDETEVGNVYDSAFKFAAYLKRKYIKFEDVVKSGEKFTPEIEEKLKKYALEFLKSI